MTSFRASAINGGSQSFGIPLWGIGKIQSREAFLNAIRYVIARSGKISQSNEICAQGDPLLRPKTGCYPMTCHRLSQGWPQHFRPKTVRSDQSDLISGQRLTVAKIACEKEHLET